MNPIKLKNVGNRLARHALIAAGALLVFAGTMACGDDASSPSSSYHSICEVQKDCLDDQFERTHGTVDGCATAMKANANLSTKSGECLKATEAVYECRADKVQCRNNQISYGGGCSAEVSAQTTACRGEIAGTATFTALCESLENCMGESDFNNTYGGMETCIADNEQSIDEHGQSCKKITSDFLYCTVDNLTCDQGMPNIGPECDDEIDTFEMQCASNGS